jgi:hypothetical protein
VLLILTAYTGGGDWVVSSQHLSLGIVESIHYGPGFLLSQEQ